jgi:nucleotide-binding universal stress UspA family protein
MTAAAGPIHYPSRILCPTDFTPFSSRALAHAIAVARPAQAEISLLHVALVPVPSIEQDDEPEWMPLGPAERTGLLEHMRRCAAPADAAGLTTHLVLRSGIPGDEIVRAADVLGADLIVMASHGRRGFQRLLGSHAERVLRTASCPVLVVGGSADPGAADAPVQIRQIVCAASGSEHSPQTVEYARCLAAGMGARLTPVHVTEGVPHSEILRCVKERGAELIVIGVHDRGPLGLGHLGSTFDRVLRDAECAVLAVTAAPPLAETEAARDGAATALAAGGRS